MSDPFNLERFVTAQRDIYVQACAELRAGRKRSHWMWFVFPQLKGLGRSLAANRYGIASRREAESYLRHPLLGTRLRECSRLVTEIQGRRIQDIFGYPDYLKFCSSMTLFAHVTPDNAVFEEPLRKYFAGEYDSATLDLLENVD